MRWVAAIEEREIQSENVYGNQMPWLYLNRVVRSHAAQHDKRI